MPLGKCEWLILQNEAHTHQCPNVGIVRCGICGILICGKHGLLGKLHGARCYACAPPNPSAPHGCGECPACEEGHPERCTKETP